MTTIPLRFINDHLFFELPDGLFLVDTGAPQTLGPGETLTLAGVTVPLQRTFLGATVEAIRGFVGVPFTGLVGQDLLLQLDIVFDLPRQQATVAALPTLHVRGEPVELRGPGFPQVPVDIDGQRHQFLLDTGAQLSFFQLDEVPGRFEPAGTVVDFFPGFGSFEVDTFKVPVTIGGVTETLRFGRLPFPLDQLLGLTGTGGIVGAELLVGRQVGFFPLRHELVVGPRDDNAARAD